MFLRFSDIYRRRGDTGLIGHLGYALGLFNNLLKRLSTLVELSFGNAQEHMVPGERVMRPEPLFVSEPLNRPHPQASRRGAP